LRKAASAGGQEEQPWDVKSSTTPLGASWAKIGPAKATPATRKIKNRGAIHLHLFFRPDGKEKAEALIYQRRDNLSGPKREVTNG
jgi:hypothetical protein